MSASSEPTAVVPPAPPAVGRATGPRYEIAVTLPADLHARPAGRLARTAARFRSALSLEHAGRTVDPSGVLAVMGLGATAGSTVIVRAEGDDAAQAVEALAAALTEDH
jgi:phosphocarrier protein HPr